MPENINNKEMEEEILDKEGDFVLPETDIYVMPQEFYEPLQRKSGSKLKWILLIFGLVFVAFGIGTAYVLLFHQEPVGPSSSVLDIDTVIDIKEEEETGEEIMATSTIDIIPTEEEEAPEMAEIPNSLDIDQDGLTDVEEMLVGTDYSLADTDGDGFKDGSELLAGYNPLEPFVDLSASGLFQSYVNEEPRFSLKLPAVWEQSHEDGEKSIVRFTALNGDMFILELKTNPTSLTLEEWLKDFYSDSDIHNILETKVFGTLTGKYDKGNREAFINLGGEVLVLTYDVGQKLEVAYPTIWQYILTSFSLL